MEFNFEILCNISNSFLLGGCKVRWCEVAVFGYEMTKQGKRNEQVGGGGSLDFHAALEILIAFVT